MLWLAGLMGLMAVGAVTFVETGTDDDESDLTQLGNDSNEGDASLNDVLTGTDQSDVIDGGAGDDQIGGGDGADTLHGGTGNDDVYGGDDDDDLFGDEGDDTLHGQNGDDAIFGGDDADTFYGNNDDDVLHGGAGNDTLQGSEGDDLLFGDDDDDALQGGLDNDTLDGGMGEDTLFGGWGDDALSGIIDDPDADGIQDIDGLDFLNGGGGDDQITAGNLDVVTTGEGADEVILGDWITEGNSATITDFDALEDSIVLVWDDAQGDEPEIALEADPEDDSLIQVLMDGVAVATLDADSELDISDIALIPQSVAASTGIAGL